FGRKRIITVGLLVFMLGSVVAALATSIQMVLVGRALQGMGAIGAALLALTADLTREEHRTKAMAVVGASIGLAFIVALLLGPLLAPLIGLHGIFWLTAALAGLAMLILHLLVPTPQASHQHPQAGPAREQVKGVLADTQLLRLDLGIFLLHAIMTASFVVIPLTLRDRYGAAADSHWTIYAMILPLSFLLMAPFVMYADRKNRLKHVFVGAIAVLLGAQLGMLASPPSLTLFVLALLVYFMAFNVLEASLPSLVSRLAPARAKGTALGVYSTSQYLGAGMGGTVGGLIYAHQGIHAVFGVCAGLGLLWLLAALGMHNPRALTTRLLRVAAGSDGHAQQLSRRLESVTGVSQAVVVANEGLAYLKVDEKTLDEVALQAFAATDDGEP
ncbi:MAG: MFS transporter, partial [Gammaproteobacteria bacterium]|nr:MFS transporter [Gammaproteobacteria bacterium]